MDDVQYSRRSPRAILVIINTKGTYIMSQPSTSSYTKQQISVPAYLRVSKVIAYVMYAWVFIGIVLLGLRVFLLAFSANTTTPFVEFVYRTSADYLAPFRGIFPPRPLGDTGYFDVAALFAIVIYLLVAWGFGALIEYIQYKIDKNIAQQKQELAAAAQKPKAKA